MKLCVISGIYMAEASLWVSLISLDSEVGATVLDQCFKGPNSMNAAQ